MRHIKQRTYHIGKWFYLNIFSVPVKKFDKWALRVSLHIGYLHILLTWDDTK